MLRTMLKSKIHRATVTDCDLHYVGSITIDRLLLDAADILPHEQVAVVDINNGAPARLVARGDTIIVISYAACTPEEIDLHVPRVVHVDAFNRIVAVDESADTLLA